MPQATRLTILVDNTPGGGCGGEHGFAAHVATPDGALLFDTGASDLIVRNADVLGIDLRRVAALVLSHGHYDHTGGLDALVPMLPEDVPVWAAHPAVSGPRYSIRPAARARAIGFAAGDAARSRVRVRQEPLEILPNVWMTGPVPRRNDFEDAGGPFFLDEAGTTPDTIPDDQSLVIITPSGPVLLAGCAHAGIVNTMDHAADILGLCGFRAVIGGLHLVNAGGDRIMRTLGALTARKVETVVPGHCTGPRATDLLDAAFHAGTCCSGSVFDL